MATGRRREEKGSTGLVMNEGRGKGRLVEAMGNMNVGWGTARVWSGAISSVLGMMKKKNY